MKKLLYILLILISISCSKENNYNIKQPDEITLSEYTRSGSLNTIKIYDLTYKNHEYIYFIRGYATCSTSSCVHNPDCIFCKINK